VFHFSLTLFPFLYFVRSLFPFSSLFFLFIDLNLFFYIYFLVSFFLSIILPTVCHHFYLSFPFSGIVLALSVFLHSTPCHFLHSFLLHIFNISISFHSSYFLIRLLFHLYLLNFFPYSICPCFRFPCFSYNDFLARVNNKRMQRKTGKRLLCSAQRNDVAVAPLQETVTAHTPEYMCLCVNVYTVYIRRNCRARKAATDVI
jgi:hypothetical protein